MSISGIKGFNDILPEDTPLWQFIEATARRVFARYGFSEIRVPIVEKTELFCRSIGDTTDIVEKEMYTFSDKGGHSLTLRPEGTAGVMRALIEHKLYAQDSVNKLYYLGPMFRHERPQKGRYRQFHQIGAEAVGTAEPVMDAQVLLMVSRLFGELGLDEPRLQINSLGCPDCRPAYRQALVAFLDEREGALCDDCRRRKSTNPLRALDCKVPGCVEATQGAPAMVEHLCSACDDHFRAVQGYLSEAQVTFSLNPRMVRGLDYYTRTTFELVTGLLGAQSAVAAGGRYDGLVAQLGGPSAPGIGFALGVERVALLLGDRAFERRPDLFIAVVGEAARRKAFALMAALQDQGRWVEVDCEGKSLKGQMRRADKLGCRFSMVLGDDEVVAGTALLKRMADGQEERAALAPEVIAGLLNRD
ncbi:histidine--tRNA ligase [Trichlorobacter ammonificans]|uniref:Histidine--tRNA ligase n=1 Tax=Trichlorobacter ammonificans TaxID=2916410 RepID=A0ABN8HK39_9BACT|nr:histidine--tRNA ligase [Trichlorobacter ammonificans]CAH2031616.1 Histidine--tRNA ligase [Trichlorobacter ammonificans]